MQQAEDVDGYLSLWSTKAKRPDRGAAEVRVRCRRRHLLGCRDRRHVSHRGSRPRSGVRHARSRDARRASPAVRHSPLIRRRPGAWSTCARASDWKLVREGSGRRRPRRQPDRGARRRSARGAPAGGTRTGQRTSSSPRSRGARVRRRRTQMYAAAQVGFERMREVARRVGNAKLEGEALQNLANALYFQRNMPDALQAYEDRLTIERDTRRSGRHSGGARRHRDHPLHLRRIRNGAHDLPRSARDPGAPRGRTARSRRRSSARGTCCTSRESSRRRSPTTRAAATSTARP